MRSIYADVLYFGNKDEEELFREIRKRNNFA